VLFLKFKYSFLKIRKEIIKNIKSISKLGSILLRIGTIITSSKSCRICLKNKIKKPIKESVILEYLFIYNC
ncbi:MAG: Zn-dependent membrane protease YugP, partial [Olleya marilimosa]